jgi:hypothetical protein
MGRPDVAFDFDVFPLMFSGDPVDRSTQQLHQRTYEESSDVYAMVPEESNMSAKSILL